MAEKNHDVIPEVWVSPEGNDKAAGSKGRPVRSLARALVLMREKRRASAAQNGGRIVLRGGTHVLNRPVVIGPGDSADVDVKKRARPGSVVAPLTIGSAPGERAVLSGGRRITGMRETTVNGQRAWTVTLPAVQRGQWAFSQLWVNGRHAPRPRLPKSGTFRIEKRLSSGLSSGLEDQLTIFTPEDRFAYGEGDLRAFRNLADIDFVALHFWIESRIPLASIDEKRRIVKLAYPTRMQLTDNFYDTPAPYFLDNVAEALSDPGEWYLDRPTGRLTYLPLPHETLDSAEIVAPVLDHLVRIEGQYAPRRHVAHVRFEDVTFSHCEHKPEDHARRSTPQAACHVKGAVRVVHARFVTIRGCTVEHVDSYGIEVTGDSSDCSIEHCDLHDLGGGGVKIFHLTHDPEARGMDLHRGSKGPWTRPKCITVSDCHLYDGGISWRQAVGVLVGNCSGVQVLHNHIHDFDYSGVSVGWTWGYHESHSYGNIVEWNHIHDIGRGQLSDMGGIYTLGKQPGTRLRFNHIHDVDSRGYGGWGIYPDEGSSDMLIENNLVHDTKCDSFSQHYGRHNVVRNNIFVLGRAEGMIGLSRFEPHVGFFFERNIVVTDGLQITRKPYSHDADHPHGARFDYNLYYDVSGKRLSFAGKSWTAWRKSGQDEHSLRCDPGFVNMAKRDFRFRPGAAALRIGFVPFDLSAAGQRTSCGATKTIL